jgi:hypothetical protein
MASKGSGGTGYARGAFPIPANDGSRAIVRQNSITNAVALFEHLMIDKLELKDMEELAYNVVNIARVFEKYSSGDLDAELTKQIEETFKVT